MTVTVIRSAGAGRFSPRASAVTTDRPGRRNVGLARDSRPQVLREYGLRATDPPIRVTDQGIRAIPQSMETASALGCARQVSGRHVITEVMPGETSSYPVKKRVNSAVDRSWKGTPLR